MKVSEIRREKRKIEIMLILEEFTSKYKIAIVNIAKRPITICDISLGLKSKTDGFVMVDPVPRGAMFQEVNEIFPVVLTDGEKLELYLSYPINEAIIERNEELVITVFDAESNEISEYKLFYYNDKYGFYTEKKAST